MEGKRKAEEKCSGQVSSSSKADGRKISYGCLKMKNKSIHIFFEFTKILNKRSKKKPLILDRNGIKVR